MLGKTKSWFFEKRNKIEHNLARLMKGKRELKSIESQMKEITINTTEIQIIIRNHYEQLYTNKMDNLEERDNFLQRYHHPRLIQEEIENMNRPIIINEIESIIKKNSQQTKVQNLRASQVNS